MADRTQFIKTRSKPPSLLACLACRKSHLKCDGKKPLCGRCSDKSIECSWIDSRRGYRDYRRQSSHTERHHSRSHDVKIPVTNASSTTSFLLDPEVAAQQATTYDELYDPLLADSQEQGTLPANPPPYETPSPTNSGSTASIPRQPVPAALKTTQSSKESSDLIGAFYKHFHPPHPFIVPRKLFLQHPTLVPDSVKACMSFVASHYVRSSNQQALQKAASIVLTDAVPDNGYKVQSLLLFSTACYARFEPEQGMLALDIAVTLALQLGMNRHGFAEENSGGIPTVAESWRRTWWTLFILEGLSIALGNPNPSFRTRNAFCDVPLPGPDEDYNDARSLPTARSLLDFRNRTFLLDEYPWSSFAYAIEAMYIMGEVYSLGPDTFAVTDPQVEAIDASISNFLLCLPTDKREVVECEGQVDECLLVAHMVLNWAAIILHRPRSTLTFIRNYYQTTCTKEEPPGMPALAYASHTSRTIRAANSLITLAGLHRPLTHCTPFLMCGITMAATVHLPAYAIAEKSQAAAIKERLQLGISALSAFSEIWNRANITKYQVAAFAREVLTRPTIYVDSTCPGMPKVTTEITGCSIPQLEFGYADTDWEGMMQAEQVNGLPPSRSTSNGYSTPYQIPI